MRLRKYLTIRHISCALICVVALCVGLFFVLGISERGDPIPDKKERENANTKQNIVTDVTELYPVKVLGIVVPHSVEDIVTAVKENDHVSIGGGRNSMGGETASTRAVQIDMREYTKILSINPAQKEITVQAGIRWRDIQDAIDPYHLSVMIMQTYSNFTVGGSLSVNVHGRYVGLGPIILSVKQFTIVLADGSIVTASPTENPDIFYSAIGGMGGIGVISDVTLYLADNVNVERTRKVVSTDEYWSYFKDNIRSNKDVVFHNGDMYPPNFERISAVSWSRTDKAPTTEELLIPRAQDYWKERIAWVVISEWPFGRWIREHLIEPWIFSGTPPVHTRNYEASYDLAELEPKERSSSSYVLQEYFVPVEHFDEWVPKMKKVFLDNDVNILNVSIRHALPDSGAKLAWAPTESFAFVVYYKQGTDDESRAHVAQWTREMIDEALAVGGTYYLPYQPHATDDQFHRAYPHATEYFRIKKQYDPTDKFTNTLWDKYYSDDKLAHYSQKQRERTAAKDVKEYYRPRDTTYLTLPEWYIVYSAEEYATVLGDSLPSHFPFRQSNKEYWRQYEVVTAMTKESEHNNSDYQTVLTVIGWSYSIENNIKFVYENSIGKISEWIAGDVQVPEDQYAALVAKEYADFLYDYPWYDFPYFKHLKGVWTLKTDTHYTLRQDIRRIERKCALTLEYGVKALYSKVIAYATHSKFGVQDDSVYAVVTRDGGATFELIQALHYQPFTRMLVQELEKESGNSLFTVVDISGNDSITLTYRVPTDTPIPPGTKEIMRNPQISGMSGGIPDYVDRVTIEIGVTDIVRIYKTLQEHHVVIDHFYDY